MSTMRVLDFGRGTPKLSVIVPTITAREQSLKRTVNAYLKTLGTVQHEIIVPCDYPSWPAACNAGGEIARGVVLHFGADDLVPCGDWYAPCLPVIAAGELPAPPVVWNYEYGVTRGSDDGPPGTLCRFTRVPIMSWAQYRLIGPWPELIYFADCWVSDKARFLGMETRTVAGYEFVHYWEQEGRLDGDKDAMDSAYNEYQQIIAQFGQEGM